MERRRPAVAGKFYPGDSQRLLRSLERLVPEDIERQKAVGIISPHAGYMYSGHVAGMVYARIKVPESVIIMGPNHTGLGPEASIMDHGTWEMPMGAIEIDEELASSILRNADVAKPDSSAHMMEHSVEVQIPFLQYVRPDIRIVPIVLGGYDFSVCESVAQGIVEGARVIGREILIVASTDLTHYEPQSIARQKDLRIISRIEAFDAKGLIEMIVREKITMCGFMPVATMIIAAKELGAHKATLIEYMTSGDVSGDLAHVVGYAGMVIA